MHRVSLQFVKTHENAVLPKRNNEDSFNNAQDGDTGYDLTCVEDTVIASGERTVVPVGLKLGFISPGYWIRIESRSGHAFKRGLFAFNGIIDCVPRGTKILTPSGENNIEDIYENNISSIISLNVKSKELESDKITGMWIIKSDKNIEIELEDGKKILIPENKLLLTRGGWIPACMLTENDEILALD